MDTSDTTAERGSGNVFADLGLADADTHLLKAEPSSGNAASPRPRPRASSAFPSPTCRGSWGATSASIRWSACSVS